MNKKITFSILGTIVLLGAVFYGLQAAHVTHFFQDGSHQQQDSKYQNDKKAATVDSNGNPPSDNSKGDPIPATNTYSPPTGTDNITLSPSRQGDTVVLSTKLKGYSDGTCTVTITNGAKNATQNAQIIYAPDFSTCAGFSIPVSSLGAGTWVISLAVNSGGTTTNQSINYTVQ